MSREQIIHPQRAAVTGSYSDGILCDGWLYISGQGALNLETGDLIEGPIEDQVRLTMENIGKILNAAGCSFEDLVKCTCHLKDIRDFDAFDQVYASFFSGIRPARTTVQSVLGEGMRVEIDGIARKK